MIRVVFDTNRSKPVSRSQFVPRNFLHFALDIRIDREGKFRLQPYNAKMRAIIVRFPLEIAVEKKSTMDTYWVSGVNHLGTYGRWAFAEFTEINQIEVEFKAKAAREFNKMIEQASSKKI